MNEEYLMRVSSLLGKSAEIFVNPSKKELRDAGEAIRFIADNKNKKLYVWNATHAFHKETWKSIKKDNRLEIDTTLCLGTAVKRGAIYKGYPEYTDYQNPKDFMWIEKYNILLDET
jgi:hypothetical protein